MPFLLRPVSQEPVKIKMNKIIVALALMLAPAFAFSQAQLVINGTTNVTIVESGGTSTTPIYIDLANSATNAIITIGSDGWVVSESEFNMVKWDIGTSTGTYSIPFGYGALYYLPLSMTVSTAGGGSGSILFSTYHTIADQLTGVTSTTGDPSDVTNMFPAILPGSPSNTDNSYNAVDRFWVLDASKFAYSTKPTVSNITFNYIHAGLPEFASPNNSADENDLVAQRFNSSTSTWGDWLGSGTWATSGNIGTVANTSSVTPSNFFRSWTLSNSTSPLPIKLSSFSAQCDIDSTLIQWTSQTELNNDYYTVEKTSDNIHFETIAVVRGAGTTSLPTNYSVIDHTASDGEAYYLLFQTDFDGVKTNAGSPIEFAGCGTAAAVTTVKSFVNLENQIQVNINSVSADNFNISLTNMVGQVLLSGNHAVLLGNNTIVLPCNLTPGVYILTVRNDKVSYAQKMLAGVR